MKVEAKVMIFFEMTNKFATFLNVSNKETQI